MPDWVYNIGEPIVGINAVLLTSFEVGIIVLGEKTLYCLGDACTSIKSAKRLEYSPLCFLAYIIGIFSNIICLVIVLICVVKCFINQFSLHENIFPQKSRSPSIYRLFQLENKTT